MDRIEGAPDCNTQMLYMPLDQNGRAVDIGDKVRVAFSDTSIGEGYMHGTVVGMAIKRGEEYYVLETITTKGAELWPAYACEKVEV